MGGGRLYVSRGKGNTWTQMAYHSGGAANALYIPNIDNVYVGMLDGRLFVVTWRDGAWGAVTALTTPRAGAYVSDLFVDPSNLSRIWVTLRTVRGSRVFRSDDGGATWLDRTAGLPGLPINAIAVDPTNADRVWVAADLGVYESLDGGANWHPYYNGLPSAYVGDLVFHPLIRRLRAGTRNRGVWEIRVDATRIRHDLIGLGNAQVMFLNRTDAGDGRVLIADFSGGQPPAQIRYWEQWGQSPLLDGWEDDNDWHLVGDFIGLGHDQVMFLNRTDAGDGRVLIADFSGGQPPAQIRYWEQWGQSPLLDGWEDDNDWHLVGDFIGLGHDQVMFLNRTDAGDGRVLIADFSGGQPPAQIRYWEQWGQSPLLDGWEDDNDWHLVGDFIGLGHDQVMFLNRTDAGDGRVLIADFSGGQPPAQIRYWEQWGQSPLLDGWEDDNDWHLVGDFIGLGHDQVMFLNRTDAGDGRVLIADFSGGQPPAQIRYWEQWGQSPLLDGWEDDNDWHLVGDFIGLGHDQVMFLNRTDAGDGRVLIADFSGGQPPAQIRYWEQWGQSPLLDGWEDDNDWHLVGDFIGLGHDQVMFLNRTDAGDGRVLIADFSGGQPPAQIRYWEQWGQSPLLDGWEDDNDWHLVGDFIGLGHDQVMFLNRTDAGDGRVLIADFSGGQPPAQIRYWEQWGQSPLLDGWEDDNDWHLVGDFIGLGHDQVMFLNRTDAGDGRVLIADFSGGQPPAQIRYWEQWGQSPLLDGWEDDNDWHLVGDFIGLGHDQVMFLTRTDAGDGRVLIADFSGGQPPAQIRYWEQWGQS